MKSILAAAAIAATVFTASALPSFAATTQPGPVLTDDINLDNSYKANFPMGSTAGTFMTMFKFAVTEGTSSILASVTNSSTAYLKLTNFFITALTGPGGTPTGMSYTGSFSMSNGSQQGSIPTFTLANGYYQLEVDGKVLKAVTASTGATFNGNVAMTPVPLPQSLAMFGIAIAGLGVADAFRRKSSAKASA